MVNSHYVLDSNFCGRKVFKVLLSSLVVSPSTFHCVTYFEKRRSTKKSSLHHRERGDEDREKTGIEENP